MSPFSSSVSAPRFAASESKVSSSLARSAGPACTAAVDGHRKLVEPVFVAGERDRGLHVGRDLHGDFGACEPELHVQRETLADTEVFGRHAEVRELPAAARRCVVPHDARVLDLDGADAEVEIGGRAAGAGVGRCFGLRRAAAQVLPVVGAAAVAREIELEPFEPGLADLDALREQRQYGDTQLGAADARHRLVAEPRRVAERSAADGNADRGEQRELEITVERQLTARRILHGGRDLVLVVVRIEQQADRNGHHDEQHDNGADDKPKNLE